MELPSIIANREAYRRSLQNSLHDVLGDVALDAQHMNFMGRSVLPGPSPPQASHQLQSMSNFESSLLNRQGSLLSQTQNSLLSQNPGSLLSQNQGSLLSQSLGGPCFSSFGLGRAEDIFLAKAAEDHLLNQAAKAAFLQKIAAQQNKQAMQEAYIKILQEQLVASKASQGVPPGSSHGLSHSVVPIPSKEPPATEKKHKISQTLKALGTSLRSRYDPFIDCIDIEDPEEDAARRSRGGVSEHFPERLLRMLEDVEKEGKSDVVSFYSHGRAFGVHDMDRFVQEIMPKYFKQSKWNSFARQLNLYGFMRLASGPDVGGYYHELFLKGRPTLCRYMRRVGVPQGQRDRRKCRPKNVVDIQEPDFYSMRPCAGEKEGHSAQTLTTGMGA